MPAATAAPPAPPRAATSPKPAAAPAALLPPRQLDAPGEAAGDADAMAALAAGLARPASRKRLPCSFLYDAAGSKLYDAITELDEYYPYKAEAGLLAAHARAIVDSLPAGAVLVELGCGSATKTGTLVAAFAEARGAPQARYVGVDCSADFLAAAETNLAAAAPGAAVQTVCCLYEAAGAAAAALHPGAPLVFLWLGSSVGNLPPADAASLMRGCMAAGGPGSAVLLATDLWKAEARMRAAYDDAAGVTAAFMRNGLAHALACLPGGAAAAAAAGAGPAAWAYGVDLGGEETSVRMFLTCPAAFAVPGGAGIAFAAGERVLMETSRKFTGASIDVLAAASGAAVAARWASADYALQLLTRAE
jgi:uncharacterized SAM-dependent methyltransferase